MRKKITITINESGEMEVKRSNLSIEAAMSVLDTAHAQLRIEETRKEEPIETNLQEVYSY